MFFFSIIFSLLLSMSIFLYPYFSLTQSISWLGFSWELSKSGNMLLFMLLLVVISVYFFALYYVSLEKRFLYFLLLVSIFVLSMIFLVVMNSWFFIFLGWDGLGISSFLLVAFYMNWKTNNNSMLTFLSNRLGDGLFLLFFSSVFLFKEFPYYVYFFSSMGVLLVLVSFTKSAQWPLSSWLPAAMAAPTPVSALVHSSTLVTAGIVLLYKSMSYSVSLNLILLVVGLLTMLMASLVAMEEKDFKKLVALSTLSQLGFMFVSLSMNLLILTLFHLMSHAFFKSLLFISVGGILHTQKSQQDNRSYLLAFASSPPLMVILQTCLLSLSGIFFLSGYFSKDILLEMMMGNETKKILLMIFFLSVSLTLFYSYRMFRMTLGIHSEKKESNYSLYLFGSVTLLFLLSVSSSFLFLKNLVVIPEFFLLSEKMSTLSFLLLLGSFYLLFPFFKNSFLSGMVALNFLFSGKMLPKSSFLLEKNFFDKINFNMMNNLSIFYYFSSLLISSKKSFLLLSIFLLLCCFL